MDSPKNEKYSSPMGVKKFSVDEMDNDSKLSLKIKSFSSNADLDDIDPQTFS
jgi:hypothetical protein